MLPMQGKGGDSMSLMSLIPGQETGSHMLHSMAKKKKKKVDAKMKYIYIYILKFINKGSRK